MAGGGVGLARERWRAPVGEWGRVVRGETWAWVDGKRVEVVVGKAGGRLRRV